MLSHVHVGITDYRRAFAFYSGIMDELGLELRFQDEDRGWAVWMQGGVARPLFVIGRPYNGEQADPGNGNMIALLASTRTRVDRCHALALRSGGLDDGLPSLRPWYHPHYYGAYFRDPDGNKLCVCCHEETSKNPAS